jgi:uncharacterized protein (DUF433 family)
MPDENTTTETRTVRIVDIGRGPQIEGHRLTVMDVFSYLHRGRDFDFIHMAMPSLTRAEFDAVVEYVNRHHDELVEKDRRAEEWIGRGIVEQKAKGLYIEIDESVPVEVRAERLKAKMRQKIKERAEKNGARHPD